MTTEDQKRENALIGLVWLAVFLVVATVLWVLIESSDRLNASPDVSVVTKDGSEFRISKRCKVAGITFTRVFDRSFATQQEAEEAARQIRAAALEETAAEKRAEELRRLDWEVVWEPAGEQEGNTHGQ